MSDRNATEHTAVQDQDFAYGQKSMNWYGFGSPVGLGILLVSIGLCAVLVRLAVFGW